MNETVAKKKQADHALRLRICRRTGESACLNAGAREVL